MNWKPVANKIEEMIKQSITDLGLVKTGKLLRSIKVTVDDNGTYSIKAEDYFEFLNKEYKIVDTIIESSELNNYIEKYLEVEINKALD